MVRTDPSLQFIMPNLFALDSNIKTMINNLVDYRTVSPWPVLIRLVGSEIGTKSADDNELF